MINLCRNFSANASALPGRSLTEWSEHVCICICRSRICLLFLSLCVQLFQAILNLISVSVSSKPAWGAIP
eukprot:m.133126 g.133126  ORF g.133126 m.133126 type:complete len:70 (+) comp38106_c0_seq1:1608-1817(+)